MELTILLVDDDQLLTEKMKHSINWDQLKIGMVFTANNIHEAKGILKIYKVDILLCDVDMPMGSGLELVEWIRYAKMEMKCIFLSSYANFTYAQKALQLGSVNYLLKPISNKELESELQKVTDELLQARSDSDRTGRERREEAWKRMFVKAVSGDAEPGSPEPMYSAVEPVTLILARVMEKSEERNQIKELSLCDYSVRIGAEKHLGRLGVDTVVSYKDKEWLIVLRQTVDTEAVNSALKTLQQELNEQTSYGFCFYLAVTRPYSEAGRVLRQLSVMREHAVPNSSLIISESDWSLCKIPYPEPDWERWQNQLLTSSAYWHVAEEMTSYVEKASSSGHWYLLDLKKFVHMHGELLYRIVGEKHINFGDLFDVQEYSSMNYLARRSEEGCLNLIRYVWTKLEKLYQADGKTGTVIHRLKSYIDENLGGELTRAVLAGQVFLSEDYITRLFIRETGMTLPNYIAGKRMEKAARLLQETALPVSRIAVEVGYSNFSYFSKTFRDFAGCTPNEFRAKHHNNR